VHRRSYLKRIPLIGESGRMSGRPRPTKFYQTKCLGSRVTPIAGRPTGGRLTKAIAALPGHRAAHLLGSELDLLRYAERVVDLDAEVSNNAFEFRVPEQQLYRPQALPGSLNHIPSFEYRP
jgi:hypothetical protein